MAKAILALYDYDPLYVNLFISYLRDKPEFPYEIKGFTEKEELGIFLSANYVHVLLYSLEHSIIETGAEEIMETYTANKNVREFVCLSENKKKQNRIKSIYKYQSMEKILSEILELFGEEFSKANEDDVTETDIIGFYSPTGTEETRDGAMQFAADQAEEHKVLYINLERFSGIRNQLEVGTENSISDFIYLFKTDELKFSDAVQKNVARGDGFDIISGPVNMEDMDEIKEREWLLFFNRLANRGGYQVLVLDMAEAFSKLRKIFELCKTVYVPVGTGRRAEEKIREMKQYFEERDDRNIRKKIKYIKLGKK